MNVQSFLHTIDGVSTWVGKAAAFVKAENVILAPDCGMKYLPREVAFGKLRSMVEAAKILRAAHGG